MKINTNNTRKTVNKNTFAISLFALLLKAVVAFYFQLNINLP